MTINKSSTSIVITSFSLLFFLTAHTQNISVKEVKDLGFKLDSYIIKYADSVITKSTEFAYLIIQTDSSGRISSIDVNGKCTDSLYTWFSRLKPEDLRDWRCKKCKSKVIQVPYFLFSNSIDSKMNLYDSLWSKYYSKIPLSRMAVEQNNVITIKWMGVHGASKAH